MMESLDTSLFSLDLPNNPSWNLPDDSFYHHTTWLPQVTDYDMLGLPANEYLNASHDSLPVMSTTAAGEDITFRTWPVAPEQIIFATGTNPEPDSDLVAQRGAIGSEFHKFREVIEHYH
jgi:hypothetical protein